MTRPHHHATTSAELGAKARALYQEWRAQKMTVPEIRSLLDHLRCMADMEADARAPAPRSAVGSAAASLLEA